MRWQYAAPILISLFPQLSLFAANKGQFGIDTQLAPCLVSVGIAVGVTAAYRAFTPDPRLAAMRAFIFLTITLFGARFFPLLHPITVWGIPLDVVATGAFAVVFVLLLRMRASKRLAFWLTASTRVAAAFVLVAAYKIVTKEIDGRRMPMPAAAAIEAPAPAEAAAGAPHVFYLVLDGYGRSDVFGALYGRDDRAFVEALEADGFYVADRARTNYPQTKLSLASSLNMQYLDELASDAAGRNYWPALRRLVQANRVAAFLRERGYEYVSFSTAYELAEVRSADRFVRAPRTTSQYMNGFLERTPLAVPYRLFAGDSYEIHARHIQHTFAQLGRIARQDRPAFVFAHILSPHPPFIFRRSGELERPPRLYTLADWTLAKDANMPAEEYRWRYREQAEFIAAKTLQAVREIRAGSRRPVVILVQGDHGPASTLDWRSPETSSERFGIISAYRFPDGRYDDLTPDITPVNSFRIVLSRYFGARLPRLEDRSYFSTPDEPFRFVQMPPEGGEYAARRAR